MRKGAISTVLMAVAAVLFIAGCSGQPLSTREKGTLLGGGLGAATGAIIGEDSRGGWLDAADDLVRGK